MVKMGITVNGSKLRKKNLSQNLLTSAEKKLLCRNCSRCESPPASSTARFCPKFPVPLFVIDRDFWRIFAKLAELDIQTCFCCAGQGPGAAMTGPWAPSDLSRPNVKRIGNAYFFERPEHHPNDSPMVLLAISPAAKELVDRLRRIRVRGVGQKLRCLFSIGKHTSLAGILRCDGECFSEHVDCYLIRFNMRLIGIRDKEIEYVSSYLYVLLAKLRKKWLEKFEGILDILLATKGVFDEDKSVYAR